MTEWLCYIAAIGRENCVRTHVLSLRIRSDRRWIIWDLFNHNGITFSLAGLIRISVHTSMYAPGRKHSYFYAHYYYYDYFEACMSDSIHKCSVCAVASWLPVLSLSFHRLLNAHLNLNTFYVLLSACLSVCVVLYMYFISIM